MTTKVCTLHYVAPELLTRKLDWYTERCDVWSLGVCLFVMLSGAAPFCGETDTQVLKRVRKGSFKFEPEEDWADVSEDAQSMIRSLLVVDMQARPSALDAFDHPWFTQEQRPEISRETMQSVISNLLTFQSHLWFRRKTLELITDQLPDSFIDDLRPIWFEIDRTHYGRLRHTDIAKAIPPDVDDLVFSEKRTRLLQTMEARGRKSEVNYTSFIAAMLPRQLILHESACRSAFKLLDMDDDGNIRWTELSLILQIHQSDEDANDMVPFNAGPLSFVASNIDMDSMEDCKQIVDNYDFDNDQALNFDEFMAMLREEPKQAVQS